MLLRIAQVKCYNCGRACGEVSGKSLQDLNLGNVRGCAPDVDDLGTVAGPPRCGRCGGWLYIDEPFTAGQGEMLPLETIRGGGRAAGEVRAPAPRASTSRARSERRRGTTQKERAANDGNLIAAA